MDFNRFKKKTEPSVSIGARIPISLYTPFAARVQEEYNTTISSFLREVARSVADPENGTIFTKFQYEEAKRSVSTDPVEKGANPYAREYSDLFDEKEELTAQIKVLKSQLADEKSKNNQWESYASEVDKKLALAIQKYKDNALFPDIKQFIVKTKKP